MKYAVKTHCECGNKLLLEFNKKIGACDECWDRHIGTPQSTNLNEQLDKIYWPFKVIYGKIPANGKINE